MFMHKQLKYKYREKHPLAMILRSLALFGILFQFHLFAGAELSDAPVYIAAIFCAVISASALALKHNTIKTFPALIILILIPFAARFFIAMPRYFAGDNLSLIIPLDSLLLNYDRNNFISLLPFYYAAISCFFAAKDSKLLRLSVFLDCTLIIISFSIAKSADIALYRLPLVRISLFAFFLFLELSALILCVPENTYVGKKEKARSFALLVSLTLISGVLLLVRVQNPALAGGGGDGNSLMQAKLFNFDMTPFLKLQNEISMNDDLVFIVKREGDSSGLESVEDRHIYTRRFILSEYNSEDTKGKAAGFTRSETTDEQSQRALLAAGELSFQTQITEQYKARELLKQEYYLVNIDSAAFLAMNDPVRAIPFENYDSSSFKAVYAVDSFVSNANGAELYHVAEKYKNDSFLGLSEGEFNWYTDYANGKSGMTNTERKIKELAEQLSVDTDNYFEKTLNLVLYLSEGDFRYSLKPGIAPDGDQLSYFLFDAKKGYCSYFAFACALMLRSLKIPSRVAVGFYLDPESEKLGFSPVLSSMAHAWVEVWFPEYGWIGFDPTSREMAAGEEYTLSTGVSPDVFEKLIKNILDNHHKLTAKPALSEEEEKTSSAAMQKTIKAIKSFSGPVILFLILLVILLSYFRYRLLASFTKNPRRAAILLWKDITLRLAIKDFKKEQKQSEGEWILSLSITGKELLLLLYENTSKARYAEEYNTDDYKTFLTSYKLFSKNYSLFKKIKTNITAAVLILSCVFFMVNDRAAGQDSALYADELYLEAQNSIDNEHWERSIDILNKGKQLYPADYRFPFLLGSIYFNHELYKLAKAEYIEAQTLLPYDEELLMNLALVTGSLNEYDQSSMYYENLMALDPSNVDIRTELAWMYFKLHRPEDGEQLLLSTIDEYGLSLRPAMILAIIYSDMLNYDESKQWYEYAVSLANTFILQFSSSVVYYNYAILESRFYRYEEAFNLAESSLRMAERDSGHIAKGELYLRRLDFSNAFSEYQKAYELDKRSPIPKLSLAQTFLISGRLEEARLYAEDCKNITNHSWMMNFGIDPAQFKKELNDILYQTYLGLYYEEKNKAHATIKESLISFINTIKYTWKYQSHKKLFERYSLESAQSYSINEAGGQYLEALLNYYKAFSSYKNRASSYLNKAEIYETEIIPASRILYMFERGQLLKNEEMLRSALVISDKIWERDIICETNKELYKIAKREGKDESAYAAAEILYTLNPGAFRQAGIKLPVLFDINAGSIGVNKKIERFLLKAGFEKSHEKKAQSRWTLAVNLEANGQALCLLVDRTNGAALVRRSLRLESFSNEELAAFANELSTAVFSVR
ncbi:MAG: hypothetical protein LBV68_00590 [Spirochaetaceae bacterium]|jgi:Flp pilus assembly protein TadD|nr:hypothetical protein [Spirochaetaceae bacterium]